MIYKNIEEPNFDIDSDAFNKNILIYQMRLSLVLRQRKIYLYDYVDENSVFECLYYLNKLTEVDTISGTKEPIEILINSNGGSVYDGLTLISLIEQMKNNGYKIITTNIGRAFSMGFMISLCGSIRRSYKYSTYMVHDVSTMAYGKIQSIKEDLIESERLRNILYDIITKNTNLTISNLEEWHEKKIDKFFSAEESLSLKICDEIV